MNSKGVSAVIATILMLMITIALAGTAYLFISGTFTSRSGVVLSLDPATKCNSTSPPPGNITVFVRNDGTTVSGNVSIDMTYSNGTVVTQVCNILAINAGSTGSVGCPRQLSGSGSFGLRVYSGSSAATGSVYCAG